MMRLSLLSAVLVVVVLLLSPALPAQNYGIYAPGFFAPGYYGPIVQTPEIHLGSATEPSIIRIPPVIMETPLPRFEPPAEYPESSAAAMPAGFGFDYLVSPMGELFPGSMGDDSVSLGDYARELRNQKHGPAPRVLTP
jgi:hypothetical protein